MKIHLRLLFFFLILTISSHAQIMMEKNKLIEEYGPAYTTGISDNGSEYLSYEEVAEGLGGDAVIKTSIYYFVKYKGKDVCSHFKLMLPSTESPFYIMWLNDKMEYLENMKWKDPLSDYVYKVQIIEPFFVLTIWIDGEGVTETFEEKESFSKTYYIDFPKY